MTEVCVLQHVNREGESDECAKIIGVCDAVDAMLSDRPYRKALPLTVVLEQLQQHAGRQFDHRVVRVLLRSDILAEFAEMMRTSRSEEVVTGTGEAEPAPQGLPAAVPMGMGSGPDSGPRQYH